MNDMFRSLYRGDLLRFFVFALTPISLYIPKNPRKEMPGHTD